MNRFAVSVDFKPRLGRWRHPASSSMRMRKCHASANRGASFAVLVPKAANDRIFLYEICDSRAAFGTHLLSRQLATFNTTSADLVMNENVDKLHLIFEGSNNKR
jgi:hypothetical protein